LSVRAFDELEKTAPESAYWLALVADARLRDQQFSSAFFLYRHALKKAPAMRGLHAAVAEVYRQTEHPDWARTEEEKELRLPQPDCRSQSFECQVREGQFSTLVGRTERVNTLELLYWRSRALAELSLRVLTC